MPAPVLLLLEAANLFCNDASKSLQMRDVALPKIEEIKIPHVPGGAIGEIEISVGIRHLEVTFSLVGLDPDTLKYFGANQGSGALGSSTFTINGALRNKQSGALVKVAAQIFGRLSTLTIDPWRRGEPGGMQCMISEITYYLLEVAGKQIYLYNWETGSFKVNQVEQNIGALRH